MLCKGYLFFYISVKEKQIIISFFFYFFSALP
jgi:hypothetical protein